MSSDFECFRPKLRGISSHGTIHSDTQYKNLSSNGDITGKEYMPQSALEIIVPITIVDELGLRITAQTLPCYSSHTKGLT